MYVLTTTPKFTSRQVKNINTYILSHGDSVIAFKHKIHATYMISTMDKRHQLHIHKINRSDLIDYCVHNNHPDVELITNMICDVLTKKELYQSEVMALFPDEQSICSMNSVHTYLEEPRGG